MDEGRDHPLAFGSEQTLRRQLLLQLLEGDLEGAGAFQLHALDEKLVLSARLVDSHVAFQHDFPSILQKITRRPRVIAEADATELGVSIFKREIDVAGA